jgi:predicted glycosyltransferase
MPLVLRHRPDLAMSHGSRAQILIANLLRIPSALICDYEFAKPFPLSRPTWEFVPEAVSSVFLSESTRVKKYPGIKEDVYVPDFEPDPSILKELGLPSESIIVTVRKSHCTGPRRGWLESAVAFGPGRQWRWHHES